MKKPIIISLIVLIILALFFLFVGPSFTGKVLGEENIKIGYCPTMHENAISLAEKNNYDLVSLGSASETLNALRNNQIDKALIGRKAKSNEINSYTRETILESDYTLVSNRKSFVQYSELYSREIYTYLEEDFNFPINRIPKKDIQTAINKGKIVLISWEDWNEDLELVVVIQGNEKVKEFRGVFLYE